MRSLWVALLALALVGAAACSRSGVRGGTMAGSAGLWLDGESPELDEQGLEALAAAKIDLVVVPWARVDGEARLERLAAPALPRGVAVLLVFRGSWERVRSTPDDAAVGLERQLAAAAAEAEAAGALVRGLLLDFGRLRSNEDLELLEELLDLLDGRRALGVSVSPEWLEEESVVSLARRADFVLTPVYGVVAGEQDRASRWDVEQAVKTAARIAELGVPHFLAVASSGSLVRVADDVTIAGPLPRSSLRRAEAEGAFAFEGYHRQQIDLRWPRGVSLESGERLPAGERYRLERPTVEHLDRLLDRLGREALGSRLGFVYTGLRSDDDARGVPMADLLAVVEGRYAPAPPVASLELADGKLSITVTNPGPPTAVASRENNYLDIDLSSGSFGDLELGDFRRMELRDDPRRARLFFGFLERGETIRGGPLVIRGAGVEINASGSVLGPLGSSRPLVVETVR